MQKNKLIKLLIISGLFFPFAVFAETVTLKSGKTIEGKILEKTDQYIKIEFNGTWLYYELKYIKSIVENQALSSPSTQEEPSLRDVKFYFKQGLKDASEARFEEAEEEFKKGLEINSSDHNLQEALKMINGLKNGTITQDYAVYLFKGSNYLINAQYKEAITEFKEALKLKPNDSDLNYYIGVCNYSLEQYQEAITYLKKAQETKQDDELYYYLGISHYSLGQYPEAITYLQKALEINPNDAWAYSIIGTSNYLLGNFQQAKENLYKAKELFQNNGDYLKAKDIEDFLSEIN